MKYQVLAVIVFLMWEAASPGFAQSIKTHVQAEAGGTAQLDSFKLLATAGQPTPVGEMTRDNFKISGGFFYTLSNAPQLVHTPPDSEDAGNEIKLRSEISGDAEIARVVLAFRRGGDVEFTSVELEVPDAAGVFETEIPANQVTSRGVEYFIIATDRDGNTARQPPLGFFSVRVRVAGEGITKVDAQGNSLPQPNGTAQTAYRLFSVPIDLDDKTPSTVLVDDLGEYNTRRWRFFEFNEAQENLEFPQISQSPTMTPGKAFWLIVRDADKIIDTGAGLSNATADNNGNIQEFKIPLHSGWNYIGDPFNFQLPLNNLRRQSGQSVELRFFNGDWNDPIDNPVGEVQPFEGYAVFTESADTLLVNPDRASSSTGSETLVASEISWSIRIVAQSQQARNGDNHLGIAQRSVKGWDPLDRPDPPVIGEYVSVYFPHPEWGKLGAAYCTDFRPEPVRGEIWEFNVNSNIRDKITLHFEGVQRVPSNFEVRLIDETLNISHNLRTSNVFSVGPLGPNHPKRLRLAVGLPEFFRDHFEETESIPNAFELFQNYPNPFNPTTTIRYGLPDESRVTLKIYNALGEEVVTLLQDELQPAGHHAVVWNGRDAQNRQVATGIYVYQFRGGQTSMAKKMILIK